MLVDREESSGHFFNPQPVKNEECAPLPLRTVLTACYGVVDILFHGHRFGGTTGPHLLAAHALSCRFSYLVPHLAKCPLEPSGVSVEDAVSLMTEERFKELAFLLSYGSLCETAPEVRRGYFSVTSSSSKLNYYLTHIDKDFADVEARDIILNELALPFFVVPQIIEKSFFDKQVMSLPIVDASGIFRFIPKYVKWFADNLFECPLVSSDALYKVLGISIEQFELFRASWMSIAQ